MKTKLFATALIVISTAAIHAQQRGGPPRPGLTLTTSAFQDGGESPAKYTQAVQSPVSPKLEWTNVPDGTQSFVLNMIDPDTALQRKIETVVHWVAFNIPGTARELPENVPAEAKLPDGTIQIKNQRGAIGFPASSAPAPAGRLPKSVPAEAKLPDGTIQIKNQRGAIGFLGPGAPAVGPHHHYTWELYAVDTKLDLTPDATRADVLKAIDGHILGKAILVGRFKRPQ